MVAFNDELPQRLEIGMHLCAKFILQSILEPTQILPLRSQSVSLTIHLISFAVLKLLPSGR